MGLVKLPVAAIEQVAGYFRLTRETLMKAILLTAFFVVHQKPVGSAY
jgi:hypothetical protein